MIPMAERRGQSWDDDEEKRLAKEFIEGVPISALADRHGRTVGGIRSRLRKLGFIVDDPANPESVDAPPSDHDAQEENEVLRALKIRDVTARLFRALAATQIETLEEMRALPDHVLLQQRGIGRKTLREWHRLRPMLGVDGPVATAKAKPQPTTVTSEEHRGELAPYIGYLDAAYATFRAALLSSYESGSDQGVVPAGMVLAEIIARNPFAAPDEPSTPPMPVLAQGEAASAQVVEMMVHIIDGSPLDEMDRTIVRARIGLENEVADGAATLREIGDHFGLSGERIRQRERRAFRKLSAQVRREPWRTSLTLLAGRVSSRFGLSRTQSRATLVDWALGAFGSGRQATWAVAFWLVVLDQLRPARAFNQAEALLRMARDQVVEQSRKERDDRAVEASILTWQSALLDTVFPKQRRKFDTIPFEWQTRKREPRGALGRAIEYDSPKAGRIVLCESLEELRFYQLLDRLPQIRAWSEQPIRVPFQYNDKELGYVPDAIALLETGDLVVVEVKSTLGLATTQTRAKARAAVRHLAEQGIAYLLCTASGHSFQKLKSRTPNEQLSELLQAEMAHRNLLRWTDVVPLLQQTNAATADLANVIIASPWTFSLFPFRLRREEKH